MKKQAANIVAAFIVAKINLFSSIKIVFYF